MTDPPRPFRSVPSDTSPTSHAAPPSHAIQLWHAVASRAAPGSIETACESWISDDERARADRFMQPTSRNQHVVGRGMARRLLSGDGVDPRSIRFATLPHGKPIVEAPAHARRPFNLAHTDGLVVCGLGYGPQDLLGADVEPLDRRTDPELAQRYFAPPEIDLLRQIRGDEPRRRMFLRIWTLKEAFIKAIGTGLQTPLADFAFIDPAADSPRIRWIRSGLDHGLRWRFRSLQPRPGYVAAVALGTPQDAQKPDGHDFTPLMVDAKAFETWVE